MSELWRKKTRFKRLNEEWRNSTEILPYERLYKTLTLEQLQELLRDAKRLHWQALDLHRCGLKTLPSELGELPDVRVLNLGNGHWSEEFDFDDFKDAAKNIFSILPVSLGNLANLQHLWLNLSQITTLPSSIKNFPIYKRCI